MHNVAKGCSNVLSAIVYIPSKYTSSTVLLAYNLCWEASHYGIQVMFLYNAPINVLPPGPLGGVG